MESLDFHHARALLEWQVELGATDAICDAPVNRYDVPATKPKAAAAKTAPQPRGAPALPPQPDAVAEATRIAAGAPSLNDLHRALQGFEHCDLRIGARNMLFAAGRPGASVMIVTDMPDRDEDRTGQAFAGEAGVLLDRMFAAIGLGRDQDRGGLYIGNVLPWRPPQGRDPTADEIAMMRPFLARHIELAAPKIIVVMGNVGCGVLLGKRGMNRLHGQWGQWGQGDTTPVIPLFHPGHILRNPTVKPMVWQTLLSIKARLTDG